MFPDEGTVISMVTGLQVGQLRNCGSYSGSTRDFPARLALGHIWPHSEHTGVSSLRVNQLDICLLLRLRLSGAIPLLAHLPS